MNNARAGQLPMLCAGYVLLCAMAYLLLYMAGAKGLTAFACAGLAVGTVPALWRDNGRLFRIIAIAAGAVLIIAAMILHGQLLDGAGLIMNRLYGIAERAQAYVYDRFEVSEEGKANELTCCRLTVCWCAAAAGLLITLPGSRRRWRQR